MNDGRSGSQWQHVCRISVPYRGGGTQSGILSLKIWHGLIARGRPVPSAPGLAMRTWISVTAFGGFRSMIARVGRPTGVRRVGHTVGDG